MDRLQQYILSIVSAAVICSIIARLVNPKTQHGAIVKMLSGLFIAATVIAPLTNLQFGNISAYISELEENSQMVADTGKAMAHDSMYNIIKTQTESYILEKASSLRLDVVVNVILTDDDIPVPKAVEITGSASPYAKMQLNKYIAENIGIAEEFVAWK